MPKIHDHLIQVQKRLAQALRQSQRASDGAQLLAVSKTKPAADVREAYAAGQRRFGENYLQEALEKQQQLADLDIEWHFIGPIQSNKTRLIAENFDWVHSVDRLKIAQRLNDQRPAEMAPINICLQVNLDREESKTGVFLDEVAALVESVSELPHICVRGLMAIPAPRKARDEQQQALQPMADVLAQLQSQYPQLDTLSMGMSGDLEAAIAAGSTMVRVGTDIFGARS